LNDDGEYRRPAATEDEVGEDNDEEDTDVDAKSGVGDEV
jgi:hypothetical protein